MMEGQDKAVENVKARVQRLKDNRAVYLAAKGTMVDVAERVWGRGELTSGGKVQYDEDYELWAYTPPSPRKVTGKGKPYVDWIVRPESVSERRSSLKSSLTNIRQKLYAAQLRLTEARTEKQRAAAQKAVWYWEGRGDSTSESQDAFKGRFGSNARKIKGGYYKTYLGYKQQQGRKDNPLELTGRLRKAYLSSNDTPDSLFEVSDTEVVIKLRGEEADKFKGLTETKGAFLALTATEIEEHHKRLREIWANG